MICDGDVMGFIPTANAARARSFYEEILGLRFISEDPFAVVVGSGRTYIRITKLKECTPLPYTILGWGVENIEEEARTLQARGVVFQRYPGMEQDDLGVWTSPSGDRIAWFADADGNILSLSQHRGD